MTEELAFLEKGKIHRAQGNKRNGGFTIPVIFTVTSLQWVENCILMSAGIFKAHPLLNGYFASPKLFKLPLYRKNNPVHNVRQGFPTVTQQ